MMKYFCYAHLDIFFLVYKSNALEQSVYSNCWSPLREFNIMLLLLMIQLVCA